MNGTDAIALLPLILLAGTSVVVMLAIAVSRNHGLTLWLTLAGLAAAFASIWIAAAPLAPRQITSLLVIDNYSLFYFGLLIAADFAVAILAYEYMVKHDIHPQELYILLLIATVGGGVLVASSHFASFFLGLEILSVSLYAMVSYLPSRRQSLEAGIKYLVLAAASAAFLLFGMALIYADLGTMEFNRMAHPVSPTEGNDLLVVCGLALIITGIGFKLAVAPFHLWTPDVYEGAPAPVTAFIATASKGAMFALLLRYFYRSGAATDHRILLVLTIIAIASMLAGNLLALLQSNVKRILAYSSIAHMGYLLVALLASGELAVEAVTFYLVAYFITTLGAFGVVSVLSHTHREADRIEDYQALFWRRPALASVFTVMLLSLAGIPVTAGFIGKFYIVATGAASEIWALIIILVVSSVVGLFYYLRIIAAMYGPAEQQTAVTTASISAPTGAVLGVLTGLLLWFGIYPEPLLRIIRVVLPT
ncbi:MAG TPA: NADH-quinone oxidoreductase subunit N [Candidatus Angelobacter sp.]|nr:NADH-quinone oxidoreductase subunit N [Candidatus Angelobacter sp.]